MRRTLTVLASFAILAAADLAQAANPQVVVETNQGSFTIELFADKAPATVKNFLDYVDAGFYTGTIFHRVIPGFMIQGGGFTESFGRKDVRAPVKNEADNGLKNVRGTLAMARTADPNSATSQWFVNTVDNAYLDHTSSDPRGMGYCVFAKVVSGMDVVEKIEKTPTHCPSKMRMPCNVPGIPPGMMDVPQQAVVITKVTRKK